MHPMHAQMIPLQPTGSPAEAPLLPAEALAPALPSAWLPVLYLGVSLSLGLVTLFVEQQVVNAEPQSVIGWQAALKPQPVTTAAVPAIQIALSKEGLARPEALMTDQDLVKETTALGSHIAQALVADELGSVALKLHLMQEVGEHIQNHHLLAFKRPR